MRDKGLTGSRRLAEKVFIVVGHSKSSGSQNLTFRLDSILHMLSLVPRLCKLSLRK